MRVRPDSVFVSSILHTIALLFFVRPALWHYGAASGRAAVAQLDAGFQGELYADHRFGVACLAIILIGLIVVWTGNAKRSRPAWFVMFAVVWFWAFPVFILPPVVALARGEFMLTFPEFFYDAISGPGMSTQIVRSILVFFMMVVGLALPMGRFFIARKANEPVHLPSKRLAVSLLIGIPVAALALYCWLRVGVLYELPTAQLNAVLLQPPPPPPPPPTPCKCPDGT
jgi:hypothetical protein